MNIELLKKEVVRTAGKELKTPRDYEWLSERIMEQTKERLSPTTLKRLFGYLINEQVKPRMITLDLLSRFVGCRDYVAFCQQMKTVEVQSNIVLSERIASDDLKKGERIQLTWHPNRRCLIEYLGDGHFVVIEAAHTKLCIGDSFNCHLFINHEPLYLDELLHNGKKVGVYVAGRKEGVMAVKLEINTYRFE